MQDYTKHRLKSEAKPKNSRCHHSTTLKVWLFLLIKSATFTFAEFECDKAEVEK